MRHPFGDLQVEKDSFHKIDSTLSTVGSGTGSELHAVIVLGALLYVAHQLKTLRCCRRLVVFAALAYALFSALIFGATLICLFGRTLAQVKYESLAPLYFPGTQKGFL